MHGSMSAYELLGGYRPRVLKRSVTDVKKKLQEILSPEGQTDLETMAAALFKMGGSKDVLKNNKEPVKILESWIKNPNLHLPAIHAFLDIVEGDSSNLMWQDGFLIQAMQNGDWLVLEELNLAPTEVTELLNLYLTQKRIIFWRDGEQVEYSVRNKKISENFNLFGTMNPEHMGGGRQKLSEALISRFLVWNVDLTEAEQEQEWREILMAKYNLPQGLVEQILVVQKNLLKRKKLWLKGASANEKYEFNLRNLERLGERLSAWQDGPGKEKLKDDKTNRLILAVELQEVYGDILRESYQRDEFKELVTDALDLEAYEIKWDDVDNFYDQDVNNPQKQIGDLDSRLRHSGMTDTTTSGQGSPSQATIPEVELAPIKSTQRIQGKISRSLKYSEHVLLTGPTGAGKTSLVMDYFRKINKRIFCGKCSREIGYEVMLV
jgi:midasin